MNTILIYIIAFLMMVVMPTILVFALKNHKKTLKITTLIFAILYFACLFIGTTCVLNINSTSTSISFDFTKDWFSIDFLWFDFRIGNMLVNLSMLFPIGFIVYIFSNRKIERQLVLYPMVEVAYLVELELFSLHYFLHLQILLFLLIAFAWLVYPSHLCIVVLL